MGCPSDCPHWVVPSLLSYSGPELTKEEAQLFQDLSTNLTGSLLLRHVGRLWFCSFEADKAGYCRLGLEGPLGVVSRALRTKVAQEQSFRRIP